MGLHGLVELPVDVFRAAALVAHSCQIRIQNSPQLQLFASHGSLMRYDLLTSLAKVSYFHVLSSSQYYQGCCGVFGQLGCAAGDFIQLLSYIRMKYSQLIDKCIELIDSYDQKIMTPDSHAEQFLGSVKCEDTERVFMRQVFYGCERYRSFLKTANNAIFSLFATTTNRKNDATLFAIFNYLICFRMDELPFNELKKIVLSQDPVKMNVVFSFIFNLEQLQQKVFEQWQESLQLDYLENKLLPKLAERKEKCEELIGKVAENATGKKFEGSMANTQQNIEEAKDKKRGTVVQEFNLTKPKPKLMPELEKIEVGFKANPAPKTNKDLKAIQDQKQQRRKEIQDNIKKYYEQNKKKQEFELQTSKRPTNLPRIKEEVEKLQTKQLKKKVTAKPMPKYSEVDVKLNVAAILREEKKLNQKIQEEERRMKDLEMNMRDESEYENWKKEQKEKDRYDQMENQQRRKIEMQLAREAAIKAYEEKIDEKRGLVDDMKQIAQQLKNEREKLELNELQEKKKLVEEVQESKENIKIEQEKVLQQNRKLHDEEKEERRRVLEKKKEEEKVEMQKKKELIAQIRELQKKIRARPKQQIEYVSIGLLEELTLDQLKQRLTDVKRQQREEEERRRESNIKKKEEFKESINDKKNVIMAHRQELAKQKEQERRKKRQEQQREKQRIAEAKAKTLNEYKKKEEKKAEAKRIEKDKLAKQIKQTEQRRMFLQQGQAQQQANAFMNLEKGQEREMLDRQNTKLMDEYKNQSIREGEMRILADKNKRDVQKKIEFNKLYNEQQDVNNQIAEQLQQQDVAAKAMKYHEVRTFEQKHNQNMTKSNPYKAKISQMSLSKSKRAFNA